MGTTKKIGGVEAQTGRKKDYNDPPLVGRRMGRGQLARAAPESKWGRGCSKGWILHLSMSRFQRKVSTGDKEEETGTSSLSEKGGTT